VREIVSEDFCLAGITQQACGVGASEALGQYRGEFAALQWQSAGDGCGVGRNNALACGEFAEVRGTEISLTKTPASALENSNLKTQEINTDSKMRDTIPCSPH
jgi:hypothetical protein